MIRNINERLRTTDIAWFAAAISVLFIGLMFMALFGQAVVAWADDAGADVGIVNFKFAPTPLTVKAGDTVTFDNHDSTVHSVVGPGFRSNALDTDDKFMFKFDKPGEYSYFCGLHPFMKGKVIVVPR
jgi:plastocyanin